MEGRTAAVPDYYNKVDVLENKMQKLSDEMTVLKGLMQVHDAEMRDSKRKIVNLTARSMSNNSRNHWGFNR